MLSALQSLFAYYRRFLRWPAAMGVAWVCIPLGHLLDVGITLLLGDALTRLESAEDGAFLRGVFLWIVGAASVRGALRFLQRYWILIVSRRFERDLKEELFDKLLGLSLAFHQRSRSGDLVSRLTADVEGLRVFLGPGMMYLSGALVVVPVSLAVLVAIEAKLTLSLVLPLLLMALGMWFLAPRLSRHSKAVQEGLAKIGHQAQEDFGGIRIVQGYEREAFESRRFAACSQENRHHQVELAKARGLAGAIVQGAHDLTFLPILVLGGLAMVHRGLGLGELFKFIDLTFKVFWPILAVGWMAGMIPRALASARRLDELLRSEDALPDEAAAEPPAAIRGTLAFRDVRLRYPDGEGLALADVNLEVPAGTTLGVVGPTGSGKTSLLQLAGRLVDSEGTVSLDGRPLDSLPLAFVRQQVTYVPQDGFLFSDSWRANVEFGAQDELSDAALSELAAAAKVDALVRGWPEGFDALVGERGLTLSGGERQRTTIARALARRTPVLVLDDCFSALDAETEGALVASLEERSRGATRLIASHRLRAVRRAEQIAVLEEGRVTALGTHAELLAQNAWYRDTWRRQSGAEGLSP